VEDELDKLVARLGKDIDGMPWADKAINPAHLRGSVGFFIKVFQSDVKIMIKENEDAKG